MDGNSCDCRMKTVTPVVYGWARSQWPVVCLSSLHLVAVPSINC